MCGQELWALAPLRAEGTLAALSACAQPLPTLRYRLASARALPGMPLRPSPAGSERKGTRARIARLIMENGPVTAAGLSTRLSLTPAAVRRHLDNLLADNMIETRTARRPASRGRGRPAKLFAITDVGRGAFEHAYDDLATSALRFLAEVAGPGCGRRVRPQAGGGPGAAVQPGGRAPLPRGLQVQALAEALSADGYAASASGAPGGSAAGSGGEQLCQHHCPVAHVAAEFPQLCEAETEAFGQAARHARAAARHDRAR